MCRSVVRTESRSPLSLICWADSSPDAYRTTDDSARCEATSSISVDLPTPGSPPSRVSAPATTPPPRTRSNSVIPLETRGASILAISVNRTGAESHEGGTSIAAAVTRSSTNVFHCWHDGHRPIHFGEAAPHCWQTYCVLLLTYTAST